MSRNIDSDFSKNILDFSSVNELILENGIYILSEDIDLKNNYFFPKNKKLIIKEGVNINFTDDVILSSEGSILFNGTKEKPIRVFSNNAQGSIVLQNNKYKLNHVEFNNLSYPKDMNKILYGGVNIINSKVYISNTLIKNSNRRCN